MEKEIFSTNSAETTGHSQVKKESQIYLPHYTVINSDARTQKILHAATKIPPAATKIPPAATKTWRSEINK